MTQSFEDFLMEHFARNNPHTDDEMTEQFEKWLEGQGVQYIIDLAEKWHTRTNKELIKDLDRGIALLERIHND